MPPPANQPNPRFFAQLSNRGRAGAADYFYQVIIVVIGVFLGITIESMASDRERSQKAKAALVQLLGDMRQDDADMTRIIEAQRGQVRDFSEIAAWLGNSGATESARVDSLLQKVVTSLTVYPRRGLYSSMISAGQIALLPEQLTGSVVNLYEHVYPRLVANGEHYDYSLERDFLPAYARSWDPARRSLLTPDRAERIRLRNTILLMRAWSDYYANLVAESRRHLQDVMGEIEKSKSS